MRVKNPAGAREDYDAEPRQFKDMLWVVTQCVVRAAPAAPLTVFRLDEAELFQNLLYQMRRDCPTIASSSDAVWRAILAGTEDG